MQEKAQPQPGSENEKAVLASFQRQAAACRELGSPFTAWLCENMAEMLVAAPRLRALVMSWKRDASATGDAVAIRICGGLHILALSKRSHELAELYRSPSMSARMREAIEEALCRHEDFFLQFIESPPQTNEIARAAVLYPSFSLIAARAGLPLQTMEIGASAGLNLNLDRFSYRLGGRQIGAENSPVLLEPGWSGETPDCPEPVIAERFGCDLRPFDLSRPEEHLRLLCYIWPDQGERLHRMRAALEVARRHPPHVEKTDALSFLRARLKGPAKGRVRVIYSTCAWQYLPSEDRQTGEALIRAAGQEATQAAPLAWLRLEADETSPGAPISLCYWPDDVQVELGRGDFHGRWVDWRGRSAFS